METRESNSASVRLRRALAVVEFAAAGLLLLFGVAEFKLNSGETGLIETER